MQGSPALALAYLALISLERGEGQRASDYLDRIAPGVVSSPDNQQMSLVTFRELLRARLDGRVDDLLDQVAAGVALELTDGDPQAAALYLDSGIRHVDGNERAAVIEGLAERVESAAGPSRTAKIDQILAEVRGLVASLAGDHDAAADAYAQALALARSAAKDYPLARVLTGYGAALVRAGRAEEAAPLLAEARELFTRMGATIPLEQLDAIEAREAGEVRI